jgi:hypothetical protein
LLSCSIFADIVALESLQPQGLDNNLSLQSATARFPAYWIGGSIEVKEASLHNTLNEMQPLNSVEQLCQNMAQLMSHI